MPVDASIFGQIQRPNLVAPQVNPLEQLGQALQLQGAQYNIRKAQREDADTNALNEAYRTSVGADGKLDRNKLVQAAAQGGLGSKLPAIQKQFADQDMADAKLQETKLQAQKQKIELGGQAMGALRADPSLANAHATIDLMTQHGIYTPEQAAQFKAGFERDPSIIPTFADRMFRMALSAKDQLGKVDNRNTGGQTQTLSTDPVSGKVTVLNTVQNTQSPDSVAQVAEQRRAHDMQDQRARETQQMALSKPFEITGEDGKPVLVQQDKQGNIRPVAGYGPKQGASKPLTDTQAKALQFGTRMQAAEDVLGDLASKGTTTSIPGSRAGYGVGAVVSALQPAENQQLDQAKRDFINAVLRRESGAAISASEFDSAEKQYFPQQGDSEQVKAQKKQNRMLATRGILAEVPDADNRVAKLRAPTQAAAADVPGDIAAILAKHGGK